MLAVFPPRRIVAAVAAASCLSSAGAAVAGEPVGVVPGRVDGAGPRAGVVAGRIEAAVADGLSRVAEAEVRELELPAGCEDAACRAEAAREGGVRWLVSASVAVEDRDYAVTVAVTDARGLVPVLRERFECQICGLDELAERTADVTAKLVAAALEQGTAEGHVAVVTAPPGASVTVDGTMVGETPVALDLEPGRHRVRVERAGYAVVEREVVVPAGGDLRLDVPLVRLSAPQRWQRPAGIAAVTTGAAAFAAGVVLLALDGRPYRLRCSGSDVDADGDCRFNYDTIAGGATLAVLGTAAVTAGIFWLVASRKASRR